MLDNDLGYDDFDPTNTRKGLENGGLVPPGKYHVRLDECGDKVAGTTSLKELTFTIMGGVHVGKDVAAKLWQSDKVANRNRAMLFESALGMIAKTTDKWRRVAGKDTFADAIGQECVVEVEHEKYVNKTSGKEVLSAVVTFNGIWAPTDKEVAHVMKGSVGTRAPEAKKAIDVSSL